MRVFVGIPASEQLRDAALQWRTRHAAGMPVRWIEDANLHTTLLPPWNAPDAAKPIAALCTAPLAEPLSLTFTRVEFGPPRQPRLIWAVAQTPPALVALRDAVAAALDRPIEARPLLAHLTLARFRPESFARFPAHRLPSEVRWRMDVREVMLFASHLDRGGARYEPLARAPLA